MCVLIDTDEVIPLATSIKPEETLGIDLGIIHVLIDSDGHKVDNPKHLLKAIYVQEFINQRHDFIHQETAKLAVKNHATSFVLEDLNIMGDTRCSLGFFCE